MAEFFNNSCRGFFALLNLVLPNFLLLLCLKLGTYLYKNILGPSSSKLHRLDPYTLLKTGFLPHRRKELEAVQWVQLKTSIPVPCIYGLQEDHEAEKGHLLVEYLDVAWPKMDDFKRVNIVSQLHTYMAELRSLPQPEPSGWIGSCSGGPVMDHRITTEDCTLGPAASVSDFHDLLFDSLRRHSETRFQAVRAHYNDNPHVVFTHADFGPQNTPVDSAKGCVVAILDWEMAGWRPAYWEYRKALYSGDDTMW